LGARGFHVTVEMADFCTKGSDMATLDLHFIDELIGVRQAQHGGGRGAPPLQGGHRIGASINRSCIVMLSAVLQSYIEDVFKEAANRAFPQLVANGDAFDRYWKQLKTILEAAKELG
jgi:hypothetical protein